MYRVHIDKGLELNVGNGIAAMRREKGLKQIELAERLGISQPLLSYYENGRALADWELVKQMAKELECTVGDLYRPALLEIIQRGG